MIKEGEIGLVFKFFDLILHVVRVLWVVVELGVVLTYARTSNVTNYSDKRDQTNQTIKQGLIINFYLIKTFMVS